MTRGRLDQGQMASAQLQVLNSPPLVGAFIRAAPADEAARTCALRGGAVLSLHVRGREPLTGHGVKDATTDPATIEAWWSCRPSPCAATTWDSGACGYAPTLRKAAGSRRPTEPSATQPALPIGTGDAPGRRRRLLRAAHERRRTLAGTAAEVPVVGRHRARSTSAGLPGKSGRHPVAGGSGP